MAVRRLDHVGVVVEDLDGAIEFFLDLGLVREDGASVAGEWVGKVIGLEDVRAEVVFMRAPDGGTAIELSKFHSPIAEGGADPAPANRAGLRHLAFLVEDLDAIIERLRERGVRMVGEIRQYKDIFRLCYVRGPESIIVELAERIGTGR